MAIESRHVNANVRFLDVQRDTVQTLTRIRSNIQGTDVEYLAEAIQNVRGRPLGTALLTMVSELVRPE